MLVRNAGRGAFMTFNADFHDVEMY